MNSKKERVGHAMRECRAIAIPFGIYWALIMGTAAALSYARNPAQPYYWGNMVLIALFGYALILGVIFIANLFRKIPRG
jgi:hypothetical protein